MDEMKELLIDRVLEEDTFNNNTESKVGAKSKSKSVNRRGPYTYAHFRCDHAPNRSTNCFNVTIGFKQKNTGTALVRCSEEIIADEKTEEYLDDCNSQDLSRSTNDMKGDQTLPLDENTSIASEELVMDSSIVKMNTGDSSINSSFNLSINSEDILNYEKKTSSDFHDSDIDIYLDSSSSAPVPAVVEEPKIEYRTDDILKRYGLSSSMDVGRSMNLKNANHEIFSSPGSSNPRKVTGKSTKKTFDIQEVESKKPKSVLKPASVEPVAPELKKKPTFQCNVCSKWFTTKFNLKKHHQNLHTEKKLN